MTAVRKQKRMIKRVFDPAGIAGPVMIIENRCSESTTIKFKQMNLIKYLFLLCLILCCTFGFAQGNAQIVVKAVATDAGINITWFSSDANIWKDGLNSGYTITRQTQNGDSNNFKDRNIMPQDRNWFAANVKPNGGVLFPIGEILYKDDFSLPVSGNTEGWTLKYNYIVYEATQNHEIAKAVGLGFTDTTVKKGETYTYIIRHIPSGQSNSITILSESGTEIIEPQDFEPTFTFPEGNSLSYMYQLSQPFVLNAIIGKARPHLDSIVLRWGPTTPEVWRDAMEDGYDIYRTAGQDVRKKIASVFPWNEKRFRQIPRTDSLALLAASFVKDRGQPQKMEGENFFEKASMASNYHGFALMVADRSPLAAEILGLMYVDRDVQPGEVYIYEIETKRLKSSLPPLDIRVINEFEPLLPPEGFSIIKGEKQVTLQWLSNSNLTKYGSYVVERASEQDSVFQILTEPPLIFVKEGTVEQPYFQFIDHLPNNQVIYRYRLRGSNAFGEWSEYAYGLGYGIDKTPPEPISIHSGSFEEDSIRLRIAWKLPEILDDIEYHQVFLSEHQDYNYSAVSVKLSPMDTVFYFNVKDMFTDRSFYFKVMTQDSSGNSSMSIFRFVSVPDLEKPLAPENFKVTIDSLGVISAIWSPSKSHDVQGYYIYYSNDDGTDLTMHNDFLHKDTTYSWTIPLTSLTKNIYIGLKAEDDNYNRSNISDIIKLRRPDKIAPPKPFLSQLLLEDESIYLQWKRSSATDVEKYVVFRKIIGDSIEDWTVLDTLDKENLEYNDWNYPHDRQVEYAIKAIDDFDNVSVLSNSLPIKTPFPKNKFMINFQKLKVADNDLIEIEWDTVDTKKSEIQLPFKYQIFRSIGNEELKIYKEFDQEQSKVTDKVEQKNVLYNYAIRVKFENEKVGALSEVRSIIIK